MEKKRNMIGMLVALVAWMTGLGCQTVEAFAPSLGLMRQQQQQSYHRMATTGNGSEIDPVKAAVNAMYGGGALEAPEKTRERIQELVQQHPVLLFMKGSKLFPQCGFSDTATKILDALKTDFHAVDVLSDPAIRQGIKDYSQWPTIPQLYVRGEFIGGSDIMLEMYQNGELAALLKEKES